MKLRNLFKKITLKKSVLGLALIAAVAVPVAGNQLAKAGYGPTRERIYDWNNVADRGGAATPTFNSFINTDVYGDERNLTRIAPVVAGQAAKAADYSKENVTANADGEYWVRMYVHNNANQDLNDADSNYVGIAKNTKVRIAIAEGQANGVDVMGYISADNATGVYDTGTLVNDTQRFSVSYIPGSASIVNHAHKDGMPISDEIVSANGTKIGFEQMNGELPGCFQYSAYVFVKVKVSTPKVQIAKTVRKVAVAANGTKTGVGEFAESVTTKPGDLVSFKLTAQNKGTAQANNVTIRDTLPAGLTLDPGSIVYVSSNFPNGKALPDTALTSGGTNMQSYGPNGDGNVYFRAIVGQPINNNCELVNTAFVKADNSPESSDTAKVVIENSYCVRPPVASYECTLLKLTQDASNPRKVTATITANKDTTTKISSYVIDFNDGTTPVTTNTNPYTYTYAKDGTFNVVAKVNFTLADGTTKNNIAGNGCVAKVTVTTTKPTTPTTTTLPNTGVGSTVAVFLGTSIIGAFLYRMRMLRSNV